VSLQVQELGLASLYRSRDDVRHYCGMLDGLAFLPVDDIPDGLAYLRHNVPQNADELLHLVTYFDVTYISGTVRRRPAAGARDRLLLRVRRSPPLFPPATWTQHETTLAGRERTNNVCEGWNNAFANMVGHQHPSLWALLSALQHDQAMVATALLQHMRGQPPAKRTRRAVQQQQQRLHKLCCERRDGTRSLESTLRAVGHCVRLQ